MDRRTALKWLATVLGTVPSIELKAVVAKNIAGYGPDPDLTAVYHPGELWPLTLTDEQRRIAAALCDTIIPADDESPAASQVGVVDFIDEWISAPYPDQRKDRDVILSGLTWIDGEARNRFQSGFVGINEQDRATICDDICYEPEAKPVFKQAATFFACYRNLTAGGFYTTPQGFKDLKYVGNVPMVNFEGPPPEVLKKLSVL